VTRLALSPPALPFTHAGARLRGSFSPSSCATRLAQTSSRGVLPSFRVSTHSTRRSSLDVRHLSWGSFPYSAFGKRSLRHLCRPVPPSRLRSVLRLLQPLDGFLLRPPATPFGAVTLVGFSLQGFPLSNRPKSSSLLGFPSWSSSLGLRTLLLERREPRAQRRRS